MHFLFESFLQAWIFCFRAKSLEQEKATHIFNKRNEFYKNYSQLQETEQKTDQLRKQESETHYLLFIIIIGRMVTLILTWLKDFSAFF